MEERRRYVRLDTSIEVHYKVVGRIEEHRTSTKDIGGGGIRLILFERLDEGALLELEMAVPHEPGKIFAKGEVVWIDEFVVSGPGGEERHFEAGIRFVEIAPDDREKLMKHVILGLGVSPKEGN